MVKLRAAKAKKINDFKKVKAKVGRHAKRGPVTVINVKIKRIVMPHQQSILNEPVSDESAKITVLLKQFHHHSSGSRSIALDSLAELLANSPIASAHIALVLPTALELLFDEDKDIRQKLLKMVANVLVQCPTPSVYESIAPVISTYTCSGLTSLDKGIRKDTLQLLLHFLHQEAASVFTPFAHKVLHHMLSVLLEVSRQTGSLHRQASGSSSVVSASPATGTGTGSSSTTASVVSSAPFLLMALQVVSALLSLLAPSVDSSTRLGRGSISSSQVENDLWRQVSVQLPAYKDQGGATSVITRPPLRRECILLSSTGSTLGSSVSSTVKDTSTDKTSAHKGKGAVMTTGRDVVHGENGVYSSLLPNLCSHLASIWNGLTLQSDALRSAPSILPALQCIANMCLSIGAILSPTCSDIVHSQLQATGGTSAAVVAYQRDMLTSALFPYFPYSSVDANVAVQGSVEEVFARKNLELLNTTLSQVALSWKCTMESAAKGSADEGHDLKALEYVNHSLENLNSRMQKQAATAAVGSTAVSDTTHRLLRCISLQGRRSVAGMDGVLVQLGRLLHAQLHTISRASASIGKDKKTGGAGRKGVLASIGLLNAIVRCMSEITHSDFLWNMSSSIELEAGGHPNAVAGKEQMSQVESLSYVAKVVSQIPCDLVSALNEDFSSRKESNAIDTVMVAVDDVLSECAELLMLLMCRVDVWGRESKDEEWSSPVHTVNARVEQIFTAEATLDENGDEVESVYTRSSQQVRRLWLDLWYQCPYGPNTHRAATTVMMCVCRMDASTEERDYFLDILFERRVLMRPVQYIGLVMTGVEEYLENLCETYEQLVLEDDTEEQSSAADEMVEEVATGHEEAVELLREFSNEFLCSDSQQFLGGFLAHAVQCLVSSSSYPQSTVLLRHVLPRLKELLGKEEEIGTEERKEHDSVSQECPASGIRVLLRAAAISIFTGELLSCWQMDSSCGPCVKDNTFEFINSDIQALLHMATRDILNLLWDTDHISASSTVLRLATVQMTEGHSMLVVQPLLVLLTVQWTSLPLADDGGSGTSPYVSFLTLILRELEDSMTLQVDDKRNSQALAFLYDVVRYFDVLELMDYSRKQEVLAFVSSAKQNKALSSHVIELLLGIESFVNCR